MYGKKQSVWGSVLSTVLGFWNASPKDKRGLYNPNAISKEPLPMFFMKHRIQKKKRNVIYFLGVS